MFHYRLMTAGVAVSLLAGFAASQNTPAKVPEPEFNMQFFALDAAGSLLPLERKQGNTQTKVRALGYGGADGLTVFTGESSPVRFKEDQKLEFVFRFDAGAVDPSTMLLRRRSLVQGDCCASAIWRRKESLRPPFPLQSGEGLRGTTFPLEP